MTNEDIQRIDQAAKEYQDKTMFLSDGSAFPFSAFKSGAEYEHPIAWNAAIEEVLNLTIYGEGFIKFSEIQKLKK